MGEWWDIFRSSKYSTDKSSRQKRRILYEWQTNISFAILETVTFTRMRVKYCRNHTCGAHLSSKWKCFLGAVPVLRTNSWDDACSACCTEGSLNLWPEGNSSHQLFRGQDSSCIICLNARVGYRVCTTPVKKNRRVRCFQCWKNGCNVYIVLPVFSEELRVFALNIVFIFELQLS